MNEATHAQLERLTMTDGSVAFNVVLRDQDCADSGLRISFMDEDGAQKVIELLRETSLCDVSEEVLEVAH